MNGLSTNRRCTIAARCLHQDGVEFIIRYYSETTVQAEKRLTLQEARAIDAAGIRLAVVYQDRQNQAADFSQAAVERANLVTEMPFVGSLHVYEANELMLWQVFLNNCPGRICGREWHKSCFVFFFN